MTVHSESEAITANHSDSQLIAVNHEFMMIPHDVPSSQFTVNQEETQLFIKNGALQHFFEFVGITMIHGGS